MTPHLTEDTALAYPVFTHDALAHPTLTQSELVHPELAHPELICAISTPQTEASVSTDLAISPLRPEAMMIYALLEQVNQDLDRLIQLHRHRRLGHLEIG